MTPALVGVHLRIDRRRPASWLAAATAAAAVAWLVIRPPPEAGLRVAAAVVAGAVVAVMAIGDPPRGLFGPIRGWVWLRAGWPLAAVVVATGACVAAGHAADRKALVFAAVLCITVAATAVHLMEALTNEPFDAALVDLSPIAADAPGALAALRANSPGATVVLVTGSADASS